jgi:hypothetical protein
MSSEPKTQLRSALRLDLAYTKEQSQTRIRGLRSEARQLIARAAEAGDNPTAELVLVCQLLIEIGAEQDRLCEANQQLSTLRA